MANTKNKDLRDAKRLKRMGEVAVAKAVIASNGRLAAAGIRPRIAVRNGKVVLPQALPRHVREMARETLLSLGVPAMADVILTGEPFEKVAAANVLAKMGMPTAVSAMDGEGNEVALAVIAMPPLDPPPEPPKSLQVAVVEAPANGNGNGHGNGHGNGKAAAVAAVRKLLAGPS